MKDRQDIKDDKPVYEEPRVLASYRREDLEEAVTPHGQNGGGGCGCGCGCGGLGD